MKHKHYDVIVAWAGGKKVQFKNIYSGWVDWNHDTGPNFLESVDWRIKPKEKVVRWKWAYQNGNNRWYESSDFLSDLEAANEFKYEFKKLEYTRTEFDE